MGTCLWQNSTFVAIACLGTLGGGLTLTGQDLFNLTEILRPATPQWKTVGLALGFLDYELATLEQKPPLIPEGPPGYFREMLSQWLKWAPPNHSLPTLESLAPALQSSGHEDLAVKLRTAFLQKKVGELWTSMWVDAEICLTKCAWCTNSCNTHPNQWSSLKWYCRPHASYVTWQVFLEFRWWH